jgi:hypothetical protein
MQEVDWLSSQSRVWSASSHYTTPNVTMKVWLQTFFTFHLQSEEQTYTNPNRAFSCRSWYLHICMMNLHTPGNLFSRYFTALTVWVCELCSRSPFLNIISPSLNIKL